MNNLILCGFKRSGKTMLGKQISHDLCCPFLDTDTLAGCTLTDPAFRQKEKEAVVSLARVQNSVIATGGGTILDPENIQLLKTLGKLIYLRLPKDELKKRLFQKPLPSFLDPNHLEDSFEKMYLERLPIYEKIADEIWPVMDLERSFVSSRGASLMALRSASLLTAVRQD